MQTDALVYLNSLIGFCVKDASWPAPLAPYHYKALYSEKEIGVSIGNMADTVVVDLLLGSSSEDHALCVEIKSSQIDKKQLGKYLAVRSTDLFDQGLLPLGKGRNAWTHDILYVTQKDNEPRLSRRLAQKAPVLAGSSEEFKLGSGELSNKNVDTVFRNGISVQNMKPPSSYIQFTSDPEYRIRLLQSVQAKLGHLIIVGVDFETTRLVESSVPHWNMLGSQERKTFQNLIQGQVSEMATTELSSYLKPQGKSKWSCPKGKLSSAQAIMKLNRLLRAHFGRMQSGAAFSPPRPGQLGLPGIAQTSDDEV